MPLAEETSHFNVLICYHCHMQRKGGDREFFQGKKGKGKGKGKGSSVPFCCDPDDEVQFKGHGPTASCSTPNDTTIPFFEVDVETGNNILHVDSHAMTTILNGTYSPGVVEKV
ncbi:hypothetical protein Bbelb_292340 [Branchiostoma belcheri]|nr:hypothetical protein Bbelb_292340 [Branchiostoma belcheri]